MDFKELKELVDIWAQNQPDLPVGTEVHITISATGAATEIKNSTLLLKKFLIPEDLCRASGISIRVATSMCTKIREYLDGSEQAEGLNFQNCTVSEFLEKIHRRHLDKIEGLGTLRFWQLFKFFEVHGYNIKH